MNGTVVFSDEKLNIVYVKFNCPNDESHCTCRVTLMLFASEYTDDYVVSRVNLGRNDSWIKNDARKSDSKGKFPVIGDGIGINFRGSLSLNSGLVCEICAVYTPAPAPASAVSVITPIINKYVLDQIKTGKSTPEILTIIREHEKYMFDPEREDHEYEVSEHKLSDVALALIATGKSNPGAKSATGNTALIHACYYNMKDVALALIKTGESNPGAKSATGNTALIHACANNMAEVALALIATGESNPGTQNKYGYTALIHACMNNMAEVALALIATGESNPGAKSATGNTALMRACMNKMTTVIKALEALEAPTPVPTPAPYPTDALVAFEKPAPTHVSSVPVPIAEEERINAEVERRFKELQEKQELAKKAFEAEVENRLAKKLKEAGV
jgi:hypothetical protein